MTVLCWHCSHPFEGQPVPLPVTYDARRKEWQFEGCFCSWACAKSYNHEHNGYRAPLVGQLLTHLRLCVTGTLTRTVTAPPWRCLRAFGGSMTIESFRAASEAGTLVDVLPPNMVPVERIVVERRVSEARQAHERNAARPDMNAVVDLGDVSTAQNETIKLKRPRKASETHDVLARMMGIVE